MSTDSDLTYEEELQRNPYNVKLWKQYCEFTQHLPARISIYERALTHLPGSYKLWRGYLLDRVAQVGLHRFHSHSY
jgi:pre-mRNA-splicing factor SYF1